MSPEDPDNPWTPGPNDTSFVSLPGEERERSMLPLSALERIERICQDFKDAWKRGERPRIEDHLAESDGQERSQLLRELIQLDIQYRVRAGERPRREEYEERFPEYGALIQEISFDAPEVVPERIGPYRVLQVLGEGGMGVVYLAEQREPIQRKVALKVIKRGLDTKEVIGRFEAERQALALMDHPNIARVYDAGATEDGRPYFAMELFRGIPITKYCDRHRLSIKERLEAFLQVCHSVEHAHHRGVIHRDIKPGNILVSTPDEAPVVKIIDFGVAKATNQRLTEKTVYTELGQVVGTPAYMSPEQAGKTAEDVDHRTDIYSLGIVLYELLVGEPPLDPESLSKAAYDEILRRIREEEPPTPSTRWSRLNIERTNQLATCRRTSPDSLAGEVRGDLDWITMKAIEKERERRYSTAAHLADDIVRYLKSEPVFAGPPSAMYRLKKFVRKHRGPVMAVGAVVLVLILGLLGTTWFAAVARLNAMIADENLQRVLRLADVKRVADLETEAMALDSANIRAVNATRIEAWFEQAQDLVGHLDQHRKRHSQLRAKRQLETGGGTLVEAWQLEILEGLVESLKALQDPGLKESSVARARRRMESLGAVVIRMRKARETWRNAIASIRDREQSPLYKALVIKEHFGLVPLGRDPASGLCEFADLFTGEAPKRGEDGKLALTENTGLVFVLLPGGTFRMGAQKLDKNRPNYDSLASSDERPVHEVALSPFFISKYEVTQAQWERVMKSNPSRDLSSMGWTIQGPELPVVHVSWHDCTEFCKKLCLTLPSEAQWEYACRAGTDSSYAGNAILTDMGWFQKNSGQNPHPPGEKKPNAFGLYDMHGNVMEWCEDDYDRSFYEKQDSFGPDPVASSGALNRVWRGGSWQHKAESCRSAYRYRAPPDATRIETLGFRPALQLLR